MKMHAAFGSIKISPDLLTIRHRGTQFRSRLTFSVCHRQQIPSIMCRICPMLNAVNPAARTLRKRVRGTVEEPRVSPHVSLDISQQSPRPCNPVSAAIWKRNQGCEIAVGEINMGQLDVFFDDVVGIAVLVLGIVIEVQKCSREGNLSNSNRDAHTGTRSNQIGLIGRCSAPPLPIKKGYSEGCEHSANSAQCREDVPSILLRLESELPCGGNSDAAKEATQKAADDHTAIVTQVHDHPSIFWRAS